MIMGPNNDTAKKAHLGVKPRVLSHKCFKSFHICDRRDERICLTVGVSKYVIIYSGRRFNILPVHTRERCMIYPMVLFPVTLSHP